MRNFENQKNHNSKQINGKEYWITTNRYDLPAEDITFFYKFHWNVEMFFDWQKRRLKVNHLTTRSRHESF
ncbi:MAG: transposase [Candidatus Brocadia sapporoensis]|nr:transposase [Candidatus Brocadia sapporoensis]